MVEPPLDRSDQALDKEGQVLGQVLVHVGEARKGHQLQAAAESQSGILRLAVAVAC